jgi:hypothetical protein
VWVLWVLNDILG